MSRFGTHYQVSRATGLCAATGRSLEPGSPCIATLCERVEDEGFDRRDYSIEAWDAGERPERLFSFWKATVPRHDAKEKLFVDDEVLMDLFMRLADDERPQRAAFRFVLGLILMRKRLLKFVGRAGATAVSAEENQSAAGSGGEPERWLFRPKGADDADPPTEVVNPRLDDDDVRELTAQLGEVLQGEL